MKKWSEIKRKPSSLKRFRWWLLGWKESIHRWVVAKMLKGYMDSEYLERCTDFNYDCPNCALWNAWDELSFNDEENRNWKYPGSEDND